MNMHSNFSSPLMAAAIGTKAAYCAKFEIRRGRSARQRPHGLRYSFTLEINDRIDPDGYNDGVDSEQTPDVVAALCDRFPSFEAGHLHSGYSGPFD